MHTETNCYDDVEKRGTDASSCYYYDFEKLTLSPTQLLSLAIKKRRSLYEGKDHDFRRVLGNTGMISSLCKYLGEGRAKRKRNRNGRSRRRQLKRRWDDCGTDYSDYGDSDTEQQLVIDHNSSGCGSALGTNPSSIAASSEEQLAQIVPCTSVPQIQSEIDEQKDKELMEQNDFMDPVRKRRKEENDNMEKFEDLDAYSSFGTTARFDDSILEMDHSFRGSITSRPAPSLEDEYEQQRSMCLC